MDHQTNPIPCTTGAAAAMRRRLAGMRLSPRQVEIAVLVADGHSNPAIAGLLGIDLHTVKAHLRRGFAKGGVENRAGWIGELLRTGQLVLPPAPPLPVPAQRPARRPVAQRGFWLHVDPYPDDEPPVAWSDPSYVPGRQEPTGRWLTVEQALATVTPTLRAVA